MPSRRKPSRFSSGSIRCHKVRVSRFTFTNTLRPVWSPDSNRIAYESEDASLYVKTAAGSESETLVMEGKGLKDWERLPCEWSQKGLIYSQRDPKSGFDLFLFPVDGGRKPVSLLHSEANEHCGTLSPDGKWIAYASDDSGRYEIYAQAFSGQGGVSGRKWQISYGGGLWPKFRSDGKELFYLAADRKIMSVEFKAGAALEFTTPQALFTSGLFTGDARFDVTADGQRFVMPVVVNPTGAASTVVLNWTRDLK